MLLISHDLHVVMAATDTVICLNGHVCCTRHAERGVAEPGVSRSSSATRAAATARALRAPPRPHAPARRPRARGRWLRWSMRMSTCTTNITSMTTGTLDTIMLDDFFIRALVAGIGVALVAGPLGCFIVWRRMAYFGDTMAHSALLGVALSFLLQINLTLGVFLVAALVSVALILLQRRGDALERRAARHPVALDARHRPRHRRVPDLGADRPDGLPVRRHPRGLGARHRPDLRGRRGDPRACSSSCGGRCSPAR